MTMKRRTAFLMAITALFSMVVFLFPLQASGKCQKAGHCSITDCIPNLTDNQKTKIQKLHLEFQKKMITMKAEQKKQELDLKALIMESASQKKIDGKIDEIYKIRAQMHKECYANCKTIVSLLNDEQKKNFDLKHCGPGCCGHTSMHCFKGCCAKHSCCQKHKGCEKHKGHSAKCGKCVHKKGCCSHMKAVKKPATASN